MPAELTLVGIIGALTPKQAWGAAGSIVALLVGAVTLGAYGQGLKDEGNLNVLKSEKLRLSDKAETALAALDDLRKTSDTRLGQLDVKVEFLNLFVGYLSSDKSPDETKNLAKKMLVDFIYGMW